MKIYFHSNQYRCVIFKNDKVKTAEKGSIILRALSFSALSAPRLIESASVAKASKSFSSDIRGRKVILSLLFNPAC